MGKPCGSSTCRIWSCGRRSRKVPRTVSYPVQYHILTHHDAEPSEILEAGLLPDRIRELSGRGTLADGRPFSAYIVAQFGKADRYSGKPRDSVYVATAPGSEGRAIHGKGFIVKRVESGNCDQRHTTITKGGVR